MKTQMIRKHTSITYYSDFSKHLLHLLRICNSQDSNHLQTEQMGAGGADDSYCKVFLFTTKLLKDYPPFVL